MKTVIIAIAIAFSVSNFANAADDPDEMCMTKALEVARLVKNKLPPKVTLDDNRYLAKAFESTYNKCYEESLKASKR